MTIWQILWPLAGMGIGLGWAWWDGFGFTCRSTFALLSVSGLFGPLMALCWLIITVMKWLEEGL